MRPNDLADFFEGKLHAYHEAAKLLRARWEAISPVDVSNVGGNVIEQIATELEETGTKFGQLVEPVREALEGFDHEAIAKAIKYIRTPRNPAPRKFFYDSPRRMGKSQETIRQLTEALNERAMQICELEYMLDRRGEALKRHDGEIAVAEETIMQYRERFDEQKREIERLRTVIKHKDRIEQYFQKDLEQLRNHIGIPHGTSLEDFKADRADPFDWQDSGVHAGGPWISFGFPDEMTEDQIAGAGNVLAEARKILDQRGKVNYDNAVESAVESGLIQPEGWPYGCVRAQKLCTLSEALANRLSKPVACYECGGKHEPEPEKWTKEFPTHICSHWDGEKVCGAKAHIIMVTETPTMIAIGLCLDHQERGDLTKIPMKSLKVLASPLVTITNEPPKPEDSAAFAASILKKQGPRKTETPAQSPEEAFAAIKASEPYHETVPEDYNVASKCPCKTCKTWRSENGQPEPSDPETCELAQKLANEYGLAFNCKECSKSHEPEQGIAAPAKAVVNRDAPQAVESATETVIDLDVDGEGFIGGDGKAIDPAKVTKAAGMCPDCKRQFPWKLIGECCHVCGNIIVALPKPKPEPSVCTHCEQTHEPGKCPLTHPETPAKPIETDQG